MGWSVREDGKKHTPEDLFHVFEKKEWDSYPFAGEEKLKWFRDAKIGLFLHVGISAVGKVDIGWSRHTHKLPDPGEGAIPDNVYDGWAKEFKMENFSAKEWVQLAIKGGFRYIVVITKHHDGFHMWDTEYSDYKVTNAPMGRDYIGELVEECHKNGMRIGLYYSQRDWVHPDYEPIDTTIAEKINQPPYFRLKEGEELRSGKKHKKYLEYMHGAVLELMKKYGKIDILWWDADWSGGMYTKEMWDSLEIERKVREIQPDIIINNRASLPGDFDTPESRVGFVQRDRAWETCMPMGNDWAWTGRGIKAFSDILRQIIGCVCGDGNYLLSVGAKTDGTIAEEETKGILQLGEWLERYGESIYGTRSGPWNPGNYGGSVYRNRCIYVHILNFMNGLKLPLSENRVESVECITGEKVDYIIQKETLQIVDIQGNVKVDTILKIKMRDSITFPAEGIDVKEEGNRFDKESVQYGGVLASSEFEDEIMLDLGKVYTGTVLIIEGQSTQRIIETSCDGEEWIVRYDKAGEENKLEVKIEKYVAGAIVPGDRMRFIKIKQDGVRSRVYVYGYQGGYEVVENKL